MTLQNAFQRFVALNLKAESMSSRAVVFTYLV